MKYCPHCGAASSDTGRFCTNCGRPFTVSRMPAGQDYDRTVLLDREQVSGDEAQIVMLDSNGSLSVLSLNTRDRWTFGRSTAGISPDIPTSSGIVSREQGVFTHDQGGWKYRDLGRTNSTFHNDQKLSGREVRLHHLDVLKVDADLEHNPNAQGVCLVFLTTPILGGWTTHRITKDLTIGRGNGNSIRIREPYVSRSHCAIKVSGGGCRITDLNSLSGTWVNGSRVREKELREKDVLCVGSKYFIYTDHTLIYNTSDGEGVLLKADINSKTVDNHKVLLKDIHLEIKKGEMVALLGGSGAGKTTLMDCLNGMNTKGVDGVIQFQGEDLQKNFERFKYMIASVPQQSTYHEKLTVEREMKIAAELRLPKDTNSHEIQSAVNKVIRQLGLQARRRTRICKCSGGEQKRVNIGMDLVASKKLYCLDEPDAGLDSNSIHDLFSFLREMAKKDGKTFIIIIHNIAEIDLFDKVIMLAKKDDIGRLACMGTPDELRSYFGCEIAKAYKLLADHPEQYIKN